MTGGGLFIPSSYPLELGQRVRGLSSSIGVTACVSLVNGAQPCRAELEVAFHVSVLEEEVVVTIGALGEGGLGVDLGDQSALVCLLSGRVGIGNHTEQEGVRGNASKQLAELNIVIVSAWELDVASGREHDFPREVHSSGLLTSLVIAGDIGQTDGKRAVGGFGEFLGHNLKSPAGRLGGVVGEVLSEEIEIRLAIKGRH